MNPRDFIVRSQAALGLKAAAMARLAGVAPQTLRTWRCGIHQPSGKAVLRIVDALASKGLSCG